MSRKHHKRGLRGHGAITEEQSGIANPHVLSSTMREMLPLRFAQGCGSRAQHDKQIAQRGKRRALSVTSLVTFNKGIHDIFHELLYFRDRLRLLCPNEIAIIAVAVKGSGPVDRSGGKD